MSVGGYRTGATEFREFLLAYLLQVLQVMSFSQKTCFVHVAKHCLSVGKMHPVSIRLDL